MATIFDAITDHHRTWIAQQSMFFVATAPVALDGHVNVSPKGPIGSFKVIDNRTVAYLDVNGSGIETIGHLRENGRIVVMFCAFVGPPRILRLHGRGEVVFADDPRFLELVRGMENVSIDEARRAVIRVDVQRIADSCGYGVPLMRFEAVRPHHAASAAKKVRVMGAEDYGAFQRERGAYTIDGLPAFAEKPQSDLVDETTGEQLEPPDARLRPLLQSIGRAVLAAAALEKILLVDVARRRAERDGLNKRLGEDLWGLERQTAGALLTTLKQLGIDDRLAEQINEVIARRNHLIHHFMEDPDVMIALADGGIAEVAARVDRLALDCQILGNAVAPGAFRELERVLGASLDELTEVVRALDLEAIGDQRLREQLATVQAMLERGFYLG